MDLKKNTVRTLLAFGLLGVCAATAPTIAWAQSQTPSNPPTDTPATPTTQKPTTKPADDATRFPEEISKAAEEKAINEKNASKGELPDSPVLKGKKPATDAKSAPPAAGDESSSKETKLEPLDENGKTVTDANGDVKELHKYDPHRADKDVEVGKYYLSQKNPKAAITRFQDALEFKPGDMEATRALGQVYEQTGKFTEARELYEKYLKDFGKGPFAAEAKAGLERVGKKQPEKSSQ